MLKSVQEKQRLATGSRGCKLPEAAHVPGMPEVERHASWSTTGQNRTIGRSVISRLDLATQSSREAKPRANV